jgi:3-keto-disaccharide hydrolase
MKMSVIRSVMVVVLSILPAASFLAAPPTTVRLDGDRVVLKASQAEATGKNVLRSGNEALAWADPAGEVAFKVEATEAGRYDVELVLEVAPGSGGSEVEIACGESKAAIEVHETKDPATFLAVPVGGLDVPRGSSEIVLKAVSKPPSAPEVMRLRELVLRKGFVDIFDGKSLKGWQGSTDGYAVKDGYLYCIKDKGGNLVTEKEYSDFVIRFEFRLYPGSNNGLGIRTPSSKVDAAYEGMEIQILDDRHPMYKDIQPWQAHGSIYNVVPAKRDQLRPCGEWNVEEVVCDGRKVQVNLNGTTIVDANLDDVKDLKVLEHHPGLARKSGYIGFLGHGAQVDFRRIRVKELKH